MRTNKDMRTIKFRAWLGGIMHPIWERIDEGVYLTHPNIKIMQFTGLFDKQGKEIYGGGYCQKLATGRRIPYRYRRY